MHVQSNTLSSPFLWLYSQAFMSHKMEYKKSSCSDQTSCLPGMKVFRTMMTGGFESSANKIQSNQLRMIFVRQPVT